MCDSETAIGADCESSGDELLAWEGPGKLVAAISWFLAFWPSAGFWRGEFLDHARGPCWYDLATRR